MMSLSKIRWITMVLIAVPLLHIAAAGSQENTTQSDPSEGYTVEHAMGETTVSGRPERVVTLTQGSTEAALALGVTPIGAVQGWGADPWYAHWESSLSETEVVGGETQPNLEAIAALGPELIIGSTIRHDEALYQQLSAIAPTVFTETIGEAWRENLPIIAGALGRDELGAEILSEYEDRTAAIARALEESGHGDTTVSLVRFNPGQVRLYDGYPGAIMKDVGLSLPPEQQEVLEGKQIVTFTSKERITLLDADVMFYWTTDWWDPGQGEATRSEWRETELWQSLDVVEAGEVHRVNAVYWNLAGGVLSAHRVLDDLVEVFELSVE